MIGEGERPEVEEALESAYASLANAGVVEPLVIGGADEARWLDCELASLAENRIGESVDPFALDEATRADWTARATIEKLYAPTDRDIDRCFWVLDGGERAGTVALATSTLGSRSVRLSSLYVRRAFRRRGVAARVLRSVRDALGPHGLGLRLTTSWAWQKTVRYYVGLGLWLRMWKRELDLSWSDRSPRRVITFDGDRATLSIVDGDRTDPACSARRRGEHLDVVEHPAAAIAAGMGCDALSTLSLSLALAGWPLVRSPDHWAHSRWSDAGSPEALAYRITVWEAWDRAHGWKVETPRIPGVIYPTWSEFEAEWQALDPSQSSGA